MTGPSGRRSAGRLVLWLLVAVVAAPIGALGGFMATKTIRDGLQYDQTVTIRAHFMRFACENCLDMQVIGVSDPSFSFLVGDLVEPYSDDRDLGAYVFSEFEVGDLSREFCLTGKLHRYRDDWVLFGSPPFSYPLGLEDIDYAETCSGVP